MTGKLEGSYNPKEIELKWQKYWQENKIYELKEEGEKFIIDTPPPYPTGSFHLGHFLNWVYIDVVARFKRMLGYNVLFPQGWDCHGLPTEVKVEEEYGITKSQVSREKFRELCVKWTERSIRRMKKQIAKWGMSIDWSKEYITMRKEYVKKVQISFIELYRKGYIYKATHPVNWCPRCETAIALAEIEYKQRDSWLNYIKFRLEDGSEIVIATTRPELLMACVAVAVNPKDDRYKNLIGKKVTVPLFNQKVKIIADEDVDPDFGTGIVMICTFGDKQDVIWVKRHNLKIVKAIDEKGRLTSVAKEFSGFKVEEARQKIIEKLEKDGYLIRKEKIKQNVGVCWRCKTPVEIIAAEQWFVKVKEVANRIIEQANKIKWIPEHMKLRLINWLESMEWDWVISRQRIFATPIPVWYCRACNRVILPSEDDLPVNPLVDKPKKPCRCGCMEFIAEKDVLDTWMDSSITALILAGWPDESYKENLPLALRPQGHDIIRTWAFYTILRTYLLTGMIPWQEILINGMVRGEDGRKMSKSLGNYVEPDDVIEKYGVDALRQWAALSTPGDDAPFSWKDVKFGFRFLNKLWNACKFASLHFNNYDENNLEFRPVDRWILSKLQKRIKKVTESLNNYEFNEALLDIQGFVWHEFCDFYIEEIKHRLYKPEIYGKASRNAAIFTLREVILNVLKLLSPFTPHITEEIYQTLFAYKKSIHCESWPEIKEEFIDEKAEDLGELAKEVISLIRKAKKERGLALSQEIGKIRIYAKEPNLIKEVEEDIKGTVKVKEIEVLKASELGVEIAETHEYKP